MEGYTTKPRTKMTTTAEDANTERLSAAHSPLTASSNRRRRKDGGGPTATAGPAGTPGLATAGELAGDGEGEIAGSVRISTELENKNSLPVARQSVPCTIRNAIAVQRIKSELDW